MKVAAGFMVLLLCSTGISGVPSTATDETLEKQMGTLRGVVWFLNHPELGRVPAATGYFTFQRSDCKKCLVGVVSDRNGQYQIRLAAGQYRIFSRYGTHEGETVDWIAPDQQRVIDVRAGDYKEFNVNLRFPE
jgi:hypothetical protein